MFDLFYKFKTNADGYDRKCKACRKAEYKKWYTSPKGQAKVKAYCKSYNAIPKNKVRSRYFRIAKKFGISKKDFDIMLKNQNNACAICKKEEYDPRHKYLSVDHNHSTGKVRGLLCNNCNKALGQFKECPTIMLNAISYIKLHNQ